VSHSPIVGELEQLLEADEDFRQRLAAALRQRDEQPGDNWREVTLEQFCGYFERWLTCMPVLDNEQTFLNDFLVFHRTEKALALVREAPFAPWLNRFAQARGAFLDSEESAGMVAHWAGHRLIHMPDYVVPEQGFRSFNEFFTRRVKPGARPIAAPGDREVLISPADCEVQEALTLDPDARFAVKGKSLSLHELLPGDPHADSFRGGEAMVLFLDVQDYHRFHAPAAGRILHNVKFGGLCFGCDEYPGQFFTEHHRGFFVLETAFGPLGMVTVGIATVSSVNHTRDFGDLVEKGEELGHFAYGGSAILLLFPPGRVDLDSFSKNEHILMGSRIGRFNPR
jgi:phosphatidylserine decarboxylase